MSIEMPRRASAGVRLETSPLVGEWDKEVRRQTSDSTDPALDWFLMLEAVSDTDTACRHRNAVSIVTLAKAMGRDPNPVSDGGRIWNLYGRLWHALDLGAEEGLKGSHSATRIYHQARMATFLPYRRGFITALEAGPFTGEAAVHGYVRVVLEWVRKWRGLTAATSWERAAAYDAAPHSLRSGRYRDRGKWGLGVELPLIVVQDLRELLRIVQLEAGDVGSTNHQVLAEGVGSRILLAQLQSAAAMIVDDPTLSTLTAGNAVRAEANRALGGALLRTRMRPQDATAVMNLVLDEVRRRLVHPRVGLVERGAASPSLAELEGQLTAIRVALGAFGTVTSDD